MTEMIVKDREAYLASLPPSAWLTEQIPRPRNVWAKVAKKGGTGKTSFTMIVCDALARMGLNVLVVDFDPQGNSSLALNREVTLRPAQTKKLTDKPTLEPVDFTIIEVIDADEDGVLEEAILPVNWDYDINESFVRGGPLFEGKIGAIGVVNTYSALEDYSEHWTLGHLSRYRRSLHLPSAERGVSPNARWDVVLTDLPPGGGKLGRMGLKGCDFGLIITTAELFGIKAVADTLSFLNDIKKNWDHPNLDIAGLILTTFNPRSKESQFQVQELLDAKAKGIAEYSVDIWEPSVPTRTVIPASQSYRLPVSRLLTQSKEKQAASVVCQVAEATAIRMLDHMDHPSADKIRARWSSAWESMGPISPFATGNWSK